MHKKNINAEVLELKGHCSFRVPYSLSRAFHYDSAYLTVTTSSTNKTQLLQRWAFIRNERGFRISTVKTEVSVFTGSEHITAKTATDT